MDNHRRGSGLYWCPAGAHHVVASEMHVFDPIRGEHLTLDACKACQMSRGRATSYRQPLAPRRK